MQNRNFLKKQIKEAPKDNKNKKKLDLSRQFNEFKQRIQQFQDKNQEIIGRIRDAYSYKKKVIQNNEPYTIVQNETPKVYYDSINDARSNDSGDNYSKRIAYQGQQMRHTMNPSSRPYYYNQNNTDFQENVSVRQHRQAPTNQRGQPFYPNSSVKSAKGGVPSRGKQKELIKYGDYMRNAQMSNRVKIDEQNYDPPEQNDFQINQSGHQQKRTGKFVSATQYYSIQQKFREVVLKNEQLQRQLQMKGQQIQSIRNSEIKFKSYSNNFKRLIEDELDNYQEVFVGEKFNQIEKYIKKCENRLKNLGFRLKDAIEDRKASKLITRSRETRRSSSKSQAKSNLVMSMDIKESGVIPGSAGRANSIARCPKKSTDSSNKQKEFQEIAASYEVMIKKKTEENQKLQKQLREEVRLREIATGEAQKLKAFLEQRQNQISDLKRIEKRSSKQQSKQSMSDLREMKQLKQKLVKLEQQVKLKQSKQRQMNEMLQKVQKSKKSMHEEYVENLNKNKSIKGNNISELQLKIKQIEQQYQKQINDIKEKLVISDRKGMEKQCELVNLNNKLKKIDAECTLKQSKLKELESLLLMQNEHGNLERSMSIDGSMLTHNDVQALQETIRKLDEEIEQKNNQIYELQKEKYMQESNIKSNELELQKITKLKTKAEERANSLQEKLESKKQNQGVEEKNRLITEKNELIQEFQAQRSQLLEEKQQMINKNNQLLDELKKLKQQNLAKNRQSIKLSSDLNFSQGEYSSLQEKYAKLQQKINQTRIKLTQLQQKKSEDDKRYAVQIQNYANQMENLKNHLLQLGSMNGQNLDGKQQDILLNSIHIASEMSFTHPSIKKYQEEQLNILRDQLRQAQAALEIKTSMEQKIQSEYKSNIEQIKTQMTDKNKEIEIYREKIEELIEELKISKQQKREDESFEFYKISLYEQKIVQLEDECNNVKESEERLNDMLHQIVDNAKIKEEEMDKIVKELAEKDKLVEQLQQLLNAKEAKPDKAKFGKKESIEEGSVSILPDQSEQLIDPAQMSYFSNISEVFKQDGILQQKIRKGKSSRDQQVQLFTKTSAYIKSLKAIIENKQKRIRMLEKQIINMKSQSQDNKIVMSCRSIEKGEEKPFYTEPNEPFLNDIDEMVEYKDYDSVQLDTRKYKFLENNKQLQHEKNLAIEQNKMLFNQIELLQDEIAKAEEQQSNLMRIKDLYKDEIKKLIEKNEKHTQQFEAQIQKMRDEIEQSDSVHNWEAIKQLFIKIMTTIAALEDPNCKGSKRDQKRKDLEEFIKVIASVLRMDNSVRDKLISSFKK